LDSKVFKTADQSFLMPFVKGVGPTKTGFARMAAIAAHGQRNFNRSFRIPSPSLAKIRPIWPAWFG
jgi:hypothetical protein